MSIVLLLRILTAAGLVILLPGYLLTQALFPRGIRLDGTQQIALSGAFGIILAILVGTSLIVMQIGLSLSTFLPVVGIISLAASAGAWQRGRLAWSGFRLPPAALFSGVVLILLLVMTTAVFPSKRPLNPAEQFTEFYIDAAGKNIQNAVVIITPSIINHEQTAVTYAVRVEQSGQLLYESDPIYLESEAKWEGDFALSTPDDVTAPLDILLFQTADAEPYRRLSIWIDGEG
jgi:uncharacterized membrane protein